MTTQNRKFATRGKPKHQQTKQGLTTFNIEVSHGGRWISLNDTVNYRVAAESLGSTAQTNRKIESTNPVVEGSYLVHLTPDMAQEQIRVYCYGQTMVDTMERANTLKMLFTQFDYQVRITMDTHQEYWRCQPADWTLERPHTQVHQGMVTMAFQIPRYPTIEYKALV